MKENTEKLETLRTLYNNLVDNEIAIQSKANEFIGWLIKRYVENSKKDDITYFTDLVKLSINYSIEEKKKILEEIGVDEFVIKNEIDTFRNYLEKNASKYDWRNGSLVGTAILRALGSITKIAEENFTNFINELKQLIKFLTEEAHNKTEAQEKLGNLFDNLNDIPYVTFNSIGTVIHPLCPQAFPLINNYVRVGYDYCDIKIDNQNTENYLNVAKELEELLGEIGISEDDPNFGIIDRLFSELASENDRKLQRLYEDLQKDTQLKKYYNCISKTYGEVNAKRDRLNKLNERINSDFVLNLFIGEGVASKGQSLSAISKEEFQKVVENEEDFLGLAENIIKEPNQDSYNKLKTQWKTDDEKNQGFFPTNNPQLINRAIAACSNKVSVLVNENSFKIVLDYLQDEEIITEPEGDSWFAQNVWLMEALRNKLEVFYADELDPIWLAMFPWYLYEYITKVDPITDENSPNVILYGSPGTGKTHYVNEMLDKVCRGDSSQYEILQFHPSYTYEDFIEGIKPQGVTADGNIKFGLVNGHFKNFCIKAKKQPEKNFYFVVDEINRANLSAVFGETLSLLEKDYRHTPNPENPNDKKNLIKTQYAAMGNESDAYKWIEDEAYFGVPKNVFFIGMMNDVDKSIDTFDLALRRRFKWIRKDCDYDVILEKTLYKKNEAFSNIDTYVKATEALNHYISGDGEHELGLGKSYEFGHSFFMNIQEIAKRKEITTANLETLFDLYLRPTLKEYLRAIYSENEIEGKNGKLSEALKIFQDGLKTDSEGKNETK